MALIPLRKKCNKSSRRSKPSNFQLISMTGSPPKFRLTYRKSSLVISIVVLVIVAILLGVSFNKPGAISWELPEHIYGIEVVNEFPHDPNAFTQGILYAGNDTLFESTGLHGQSSVRKVALVTGKVEEIQKMKYSYFGEGLTLLGDRLFQVNWLEKTGFIYDRNNLSKVEAFTNPMPDGWGLATDGKILYGSDGSSNLYKIDPQTLKVAEKHKVWYKGREVHNLNELEYVNGEVWANVWQTDCIARISGEDGVLRGWIYLPSLREGLYAAGHRDIDVLNGIAWDRENNRLFLTGKLWPKLYEIKLRRVRQFNGNIKNLCLRNPVNFRG